jgi:hypothetical protein
LLQFLGRWRQATTTKTNNSKLNKEIKTSKNTNYNISRKEGNKIIWNKIKS